MSKAIIDAKYEYTDNNNLIQKTINQAKEAASKKKSNKDIWYIKKIKYIFAENDRMMTKFDKNADIIYKTPIMQKLLARK